MTPLQTLQALRLQYGTPMTRKETGALMNAVCWAHRGKWAMYAKPDDNSAIMPDGTTISRDILVDLATFKGYDTLGNSEGDATPQWNYNPDHVTDPERLVDPIKPGGVIPTPTPVPVPVPVPTPTPSPAGPSYDAWVSGDECTALTAAYVAKHGKEPHSEFWRHLGWQRLEERLTIAEMVKRIQA